MEVGFDHDAVVVGGGIYGCRLALDLRREGASVLLVEREEALLARASAVNQGRVHGGYHYPRSFTTARRSRANYLRFIHDHRDCVDDSHRMVYAVARERSHVTASQYESFCRAVGAPLSPAPEDVRRLFDPDAIEAAWLVEEAVFDVAKLRAKLETKLGASGVDVRLATEARVVRASDSGGLHVTLRSSGRESAVRTRCLYNCTYAALNQLLRRSGAATIPLRLELAEMVVVQAPDVFRGLGVTVMCGPFFSILPRPAGGHVLSHVRYTPVCSWDDDGRPWPSGDAEDGSRFERMVRDASRFVPELRGCRRVASMLEVKAKLPRSRVDDGRPILVASSDDLGDVVNVMGSKIDNVEDMVSTIRSLNTTDGAR